jgi:hypothetical protein
LSSHDAVVDLLGALAYGELSAFDHLADDAGLAPDLAARAEMSAMAATEFGHYRRLADRLADLGVEPATAMAPFVAALETYHSLTKPSTWLESVVKAYVGDGMAGDFYREVSVFVDDATGELIRDVLTDAGRAEFAVREVASAVSEQPAIAGRLALWARRLVGEADAAAGRGHRRPHGCRGADHQDHRPARGADGRARSRFLKARIAGTRCPG